MRGPEQNKGKGQFDKKVTVYSFLLTVLVIWVHSVNQNLTASGGLETVVSTIEIFLGSYLGQIAVPGFFFISGYLFFRNADAAGLGPSFFRRKWMRRAKSLIAPYFLWNLIYYAVYLLAGRAELSFSALSDALFNYRYNPVFWYLQQLIILSFLTPVIFILTRKKKLAPFFLLFLFLLAANYDAFGLHLVNEDALFYYSSGCAAGLHLKHREEDAGFFKKICLISFILTFAFAVCYILKPPVSLIGFVIAGRLSGAVFLFSLVSITAFCGGGFWKWISGRDFLNYNFFIYAVHYLEIRLTRLPFSLIESLTGLPVPAAAEALLFLFEPVLCVSLSVFSARLLRRFLPGVCAALTGGRQGLAGSKR